MFQVFLIIFWATIRLQSRGHAVCDPSVGVADSSPQGEGSSGCIRGAVRAERMNPFPTKFVAAAAAIELHLIRRKRHLPLKGKATAAAAAIELHLIRRKRHLPLKGKAKPATCATFRGRRGRAWGRSRGGRGTCQSTARPYLLY